MNSFRSWFRPGGMAVAFLAGLLLACAPAAPLPEAAPAAPAPAVAQPKRGGVLFYAARQPPDQLNPLVAGTIGEALAFNGVYEPLVRFDYKPDIEAFEDHRSAFTVVPNLAQKWTISEDGRTYTFELKKNVKWHDGQEFSADDVVYTYQTILDSKTWRGVTALREVQSLEKVDKYTLRLTIKAPSAEFLQGLAGTTDGVWILPKHVQERGEGWNKAVVGTGPYKVRAIDLKSKAVYERNENFRDKDAAYLDGAQLIFGLDPSAMLAAISARKIDFHTVGDKAQLDSIIRTVPDAKTFTFPQGNGNTLYTHLTKPPHSDARVRKALDLTIDRQAMVKQLYFGVGVINPPAGLGWKKDFGIPQEELLKLPGYRQPKDQDIAEAKRLLAEAGLAGGFKTTLRIAGNRSSSPPIAESIAAQMRAIGVDMVIEKMEFAAYNKAELEGDYEVLMPLTAGDLPNQRLIGFYHSKGRTNKIGLKDPKLDELIDKQAVTLDPKERGRLHRQIQQVVYDNAYAIATVDPNSFVLVQPWVHHITINKGAQAYPLYWDPIWLDAEKIPPR